MLRHYYRLTKPGLVWGNLITTLAGFLFASQWNIAFAPLFLTLLGTTGVIASACVFNNIYDRAADAKMPRTKNRPLVTGAILVRHAIAFGVALGLLGFLLLFIVGLLPLVAAVFGFVVYLGLYTPYKYRSHFGAVVGSLSGAAAIIIGYSAAAHTLDLPALILFGTMVVWQMPHFYAISLFRKDDYAAANVPVLSIAKGEREAWTHIIVYIVLFIAVADSLYLTGAVGLVYLLIMSILGLWWLALAIVGQRAADQKKAGRKVFFMSLIVMVSFSFLLSFAVFLP